VLSWRVPLHAYTDSSAAYDMTTSFRDPTDMTSKNDLFMLRRALLAGTSAALHLVLGAHNPADALSKPTYARPPPNDALDRALASGTLRAPTRSSTSSTEYRNSPRPPAQSLSPPSAATPKSALPPGLPAPARLAHRQHGGSLPPPRASPATSLVTRLSHRPQPAPRFSPHPCPPSVPRH